MKPKSWSTTGEKIKLYHSKKIQIFLKHSSKLKKWNIWNIWINRTVQSSTFECCKFLAFSRFFAPKTLVEVYNRYNQQCGKLILIRKYTKTHLFICPHDALTLTNLKYFFEYLKNKPGYGLNRKEQKMFKTGRKF